VAYLVSISARAERDLALIYGQIDAEISERAWRWWRGMRRAILSLEELPNRCPPTPENAKLRHLLFGVKPHVYRIIFRVLERKKRVEILHIRHGARRRFSRTNLA
jgi:toxin ParE1/3/4